MIQEVSNIENDIMVPVHEYNDNDEEAERRSLTKKATAQNDITFILYNFL